MPLLGPPPATARVPHEPLSAFVTGAWELQKTRPQTALWASLRGMSVVHTSTELERVELSGAGSEFLTRSDRSRRCRQLAERGHLVARVVPLPSSDELPPLAASPNLLKRGHLRAALEGAVEISLALRGALPPTVDASASAARAAQDQMFRVHTLGAAGLCVVLPKLQPLADDDGVLDAEDSATLEAWRALSESEPVTLLFDHEDLALQMLAPVPLSAVFDLADDLLAREELAEGELAEEELAEEELAEEALAEHELDAHQRGWPEDERSVDESELAEDEDVPEPLSLVQLEESDDVPEADHQKWHKSRTDGLHEALCASEQGSPNQEEPGGATLMEGPPLDAPADRPLTGQAGNSHAILRNDPLAGVDELVEAIEEDLESDPQGSLVEAEPALPIQGSLFGLSSPTPGITPPKPPRRKRSPAMDPEIVRGHVAALDAARGPRPVSHIEELFRSRYAPLLEALDKGLRDEDAIDAVSTWRSSFEQSYSEGYTALRLTGKRPQMVLDSPEIAARIGRLNGARGVQLLLVDAMRFDLGQRVGDKLKSAVGDRAVCVEQTLMWSALPTFTPTQLRLLSRGPRGLRDSEPSSERDPAIHRTGSVSTLRRVRIGQRDLLKLDLVEARLREAGGPFDERMDELATEVSVTIARFMESLAPRTLLYLFGDHGFTIDTRKGRTGPAKQGGASPEEVMVAGQAWLVGDDVH